jgi:hypothetical protein
MNNKRKMKKKRFCLEKTHYMHKNRVRGAGGVTQCVGPEFKPQYHEK